jgi:restriction system protein
MAICIPGFCQKSSFRFNEPPMPVPDFQSIMLPFLQTLEDGAERSMREMGDLLAAKFSLTESELQELLPSGQAKLFSNRVAWAKTHLKNAGLVDNPTRGRVRISELGRSVLGQSPPSIDMKFLRQYESYQRFTGQIKETDGEAPDTGNLVADIDERTPLELFESSYAKLRAALAEDLLSKLIECSPQFFERIVVKLLHAMGYGGQFGEGKVTNYSHDGGIDGVISEDKLGLDVVCIQAKRWQSTVSRPTVQSFVGSMDLIRAKKGVVITTSDFSRDAYEFVDRIEGKRVVLMNGKQLAQFMIDHDVGVTESGVYKIKEVSNDFFEEV